MKFNEVPPTENYALHYVSECGRVDLSIYPVIYGFRIRAGFTDDIAFGGLELDYCGGKEYIMVNLIFNMVKAILEKKEYDEAMFDDFPRPGRVKPFYKDENFMSLVKLSFEATPFDTELIPSLEQLREIQYGMIEPERKEFLSKLRQAP